MPRATKASPTHISFKGWVSVIRRTIQEVLADNIMLVAAGCAFYGLLAIFPGLVAAMALAGLVVDPITVVDQLAPFAAVLPQEAATIILDQARSVAGSDQGGLGVAAIVGILIAFYSGSAGTASLMLGLNVAFDRKEARGIVAFQIRKFLLTLGLFAGAFLVVAILAGLPVVLAFLPIGDTSAVIANLMRWPVLLVIVMSGLAILYRWGPSRERSVAWRWITPGAVAACLLWIAGSAAFGYYVSAFARYNEIFGALGGVVILLMWMWLSAFIILMGAELDAEMGAQAKLDPAPDTSHPDTATSADLARAREARRDEGTLPEDDITSEADPATRPET